MTKEQFIKEVNDLRKEANGSWYAGGWDVDGKHVRIKGYKTWMQKFEVDGVNQWSTPDCTVRKFTEELLKGVS